MIRKEETAEIGKFQRTHALKGELNAILDVDGEFLEEGYPLVVEIDGIAVPFFAEGVRPKGSESWLVKLKGVDTQEEAQNMVNKPIRALRADLAEFFGEEEIAEAGDFTGYRIVDAELGEIGTVRSVDDSTANVLFLVETPAGETVYIPVAEEFIDRVDEKDSLIETHLPEGLVNLNEKKKES